MALFPEEFLGGFFFGLQTPVREIPFFFLKKKRRKKSPRGGVAYLFSRAHACRQQWYDGEHVLERIQHGYKGHHTHRQCIVISRL